MYVGEDIFYPWEGVDYHHPELQGNRESGQLGLKSQSGMGNLLKSECFQEMVSQLGVNMHRFAKWLYEEVEDAEEVEEVEEPTQLWG